MCLGYKPVVYCQLDCIHHSQAEDKGHHGLELDFLENEKKKLIITECRLIPN